MWGENGRGLVCPPHPAETNQKPQTPFQSGPEAGVRNRAPLADPAELALDVGEQDVVGGSGDVQCCDNAEALVGEPVRRGGEEVAAEVESGYYWEQHPSMWGWADHQSAQLEELGDGEENEVIAVHFELGAQWAWRPLVRAFELIRALDIPKFQVEKARRTRNILVPNSSPTRMGARARNE